MKMYALYAQYINQTKYPPENSHPFNYTGSAEVSVLDKAPPAACWLNNLSGLIADKVSACAPKIAQANMNNETARSSELTLRCKAVSAFRTFLAAQIELLIREKIGFDIAAGYVAFDIDADFRIIGIHKTAGVREIYHGMKNVTDITAGKR